MSSFKCSIVIVLLLLFGNASAQTLEYDFAETARVIVWSDSIEFERSIFSAVGLLDAEKLVKEDWPATLSTLLQSDLWSSTLAAASDLSAQKTQKVRVLSSTDVADVHWDKLKEIDSAMNTIFTWLFQLPFELENILFQFEALAYYEHETDEYAAELEAAEAAVDGLESDLNSMRDTIDALGIQLDELTPAD